MKKIYTLLFLFFAISGYDSFAQSDTFLVKPYLQYATKNSIHVLWETNTPSTGKVEYGEALLKATEPNLSNKIESNEPKHLHEVKLGDLKVAKKYVYRVRCKLENGKELISEVYTFNTAVKDEDAYFFAFIGDSQYNDKTPWAWGKIAERVWEDRPHFIVHAGDIVDMGTKKTDWTEQFFPDGHVAMSRFPMYTVLGNHEQDAQYYYDYMVNPEPEFRYTFKYGNAQFFMVDTNRDVYEGSDQYNWLEWELAKSDADWKFVVHHHPPYSSEENDHGDTYIGASTFQTKARNLVPLYEAYDVDFCLFGHTHVYERTWPIFDEAVNLENGVIYINSGGAGGGLEDFDPTRSWFTQELQTGHHYCTFAIFENNLTFKAIDHNGNLFDTFQLSKKEDESGNSMMLPPAPHIKANKMIFQNSALAKIDALNLSDQIRYTLDGSEPNLQSKLYDGEITLDKTCTLKARTYSSNGKASRVVERSFKKMQPKPAAKIKNTKTGLTYKYFEGEWDYIPEFEKMTAIKNGVVSTVGLEKMEHQKNNFGVVMEGYVEIPETNTYTFFTRSDDGSKLFIDDELVVDSDGHHGAFWEYGMTILEKGKHKIRIEYFESSGSEMLKAGIVDEEGFNVEFKAGQLSH